MPEAQVLDMMGIIPLLFCNDTPRDEIPARAPVSHGGRAGDECENVVLLQRFMHVSVCRGKRLPKKKTSQHKRNNVNLPGQPHVACLSL